MLVVAVILGVYALIWGVAPYTSFNVSARILLDVLDWPLDSYANDLDRNTKWLSAIGAGLLATVAIFIGGIVAPAIKKGDTHTLRVTFWAIVAWYTIDSVGSIAVGVTSNVYFNTVYLLLMVFPLIGIREKDLQFVKN